MDELGMSQPAVSHHLRILKKGKIVRDDKDGRWVFYSLNKEVLLQQVECINNKLFDEIRKNLDNRQPHRDYGACLRIEKELCSHVKPTKVKF